jgi:hypothetical protein
MGMYRHNCARVRQGRWAELKLASCAILNAKIENDISDGNWALERSRDVWVKEQGRANNWKMMEVEGMEIGERSLGLLISSLGGCIFGAERIGTNQRAVAVSESCLQP